MISSFLGYHSESIYLLLEVCAHDLRFSLPECTIAQASNVARVRSQKAPDFQLF